MNRGLLILFSIVAFSFSGMAQNSVLEFARQQWWEPGVGWEEHTQIDYEYDTDGNTTVEYESVFDADSLAWQPYAKSEFFYYLGGDSVVRDQFSWQADSANYRLGFRKYWLFNAHGDVVEELEQSKSSGAWVNLSRHTYTYDQNNRLTNHRIFLGWNAANSDWNLRFRYQWTYDVALHIDTAVYGHLPNGASVWETWSREITFRNDTGRLDSSRIESLHNGSWTLSYSTTNTYNASGQLATSLENNWSIFTGALEETDRHTYNYHDNGKLWEDALEEYNLDFGVWERQNRWLYYWDGVAGASLPVIENSLRVFPNPASEFLFVSGIESAATMEIIDLSGQTIWSKQLFNAQQTIYPPIALPGWYLVLVTDSKGNQFATPVVWSK